MFFTIPVNDKQIITTTPIGARSITHVFFENKNDGVFTYKRDIDTVTISIDGKMICKQMPIMPFCTSTPYGVNQSQWQDKALEVNLNVDISEIKISAGNINDFNVVFVCSSEKIDESRGFDFVEAKQIQITKAYTTQEAQAKLDEMIAMWQKDCAEVKSIVDSVLTYKLVEDVSVSDYSTCYHKHIRLVDGKIVDMYYNVPLSKNDPNYDKLCDLLKKGLRFLVNLTDNTYCQIVAYQVNIAPTANISLPYNIYLEDKYNALDYGCEVPDTPYLNEYLDVHGTPMHLSKTNDVWTMKYSSGNQARDWRLWCYENSSHVIENIPAGTYIMTIDVVKTTKADNQSWAVYDKNDPKSHLDYLEAHGRSECLYGNSCNCTLKV